MDISRNGTRHVFGAPNTSVTSSRSKWKSSRLVRDTPTRRYSDQPSATLNQQRTSTSVCHLTSVPDRKPITLSDEEGQSHNEQSPSIRSVNPRMQTVNRSNSGNYSTWSWNTTRSCSTIHFTRFHVTHVIGHEDSATSRINYGNEYYYDLDTKQIHFVPFLKRNNGPKNPVFYMIDPTGRNWTSLPCSVTIVCSSQPKTDHCRKILTWKTIQSLTNVKSP